MSQKDDDSSDLIVAPSSVTDTHNPDSDPPPQPESSTPTTSEPTADAPFPWTPVLLISCALFANAYSLTSIFPFVGFFSEHLLGLEGDHRDTGFYAGWMGACFMIGRVVTSLCWGRYSDRHGRKPVILYGLLSICVTMLLFGFAFHIEGGIGYWWALAARLCLGLGNAITGIGKAMIGEFTSDKHQPRAMASVALMFSLGLIAGPGLGGMLYDPATLYPKVFDHWFWRKFPALLASLPASFVALVALIVSYFHLAETLPAAKRAGRAATLKNRAATSTESDPQIELAPLPRPKLLSPRSQADSYHVLSDDDDGEEEENQVSVAVCSDEQPGSQDESSERESKSLLSNQMDDSNQLEELLVPVMEKEGSDGSDGIGVGVGVECKEDGEAGIEISSATVVLDVAPGAPPSPPPLKRNRDVWVTVAVYTIWSMVAIGFDEAVPLWAIAPREHGGLEFDTKEIGETMAIQGIPLSLFQLLIFPLLTRRFGSVTLIRSTAFILFPFMLSFTYIVSFLSHVFGSDEVAVGTFMVIKNCCVVAGFTSMFVVINNSVPAEQRGAVNGVALMVASVGKAAGPAFAPMILAWSLTKGEKVGFPFDVHAVFFVVAGFTLLSGILSLRMSKSLDRKWESRAEG